MTAPTEPRDALSAVLSGMDQSRDQLLGRLEGLGRSEYLWEPVPNCWTVREVGNGYAADHPEDGPDPAPFTTIAWRLWHIAVDCMDSYSSRAFGSSGTGLSGLAFVGEADAAVDLTAAAIANFRSEISSLGEDGVWDQLGDDWGPYRASTFLDLALHAHRELTHHGAEVGVLRDLYRWTEASR